MTSITEIKPVRTFQKNGLTVLSCTELEKAGFVNAFSTRLGGVSALPDASLNLSFRDDAAESVKENRRRFFEAANSTGLPLVTLKQVHSADVVTISDASQTAAIEPVGDGVVSREKGVLFGIQSADCLPIFIADPGSGWMAAVHAGWRGTMDGIVRKAFSLLSEQGVEAGRCLAVLGPCACGECYEVGADVVAAFEERGWSTQQAFTRVLPNGKAFLDVRAANLHQLLERGVKETNIYSASFCTIHQNDLFFSYRVESKGGAVSVGRHLAILGKR